MLLLAAVLMAQVTPPTYPHAKPRPVTGSITNKTLTKVSQSFSPTAYQDENYVVWSIDYSGGLHSRLNAFDRLNLNTNATQEGAMVYAADDRTFYGVETNLVANKPLFTLDGQWLGPTSSTNTSNIYNSDGTLSGNRTLYTGTRQIVFKSTTNEVLTSGSFQVGPMQYFLVDSQFAWIRANSVVEVVSSNASVKIEGRYTSGGVNVLGNLVTIQASNGLYLKTPRTLGLAMKQLAAEQQTAGVELLSVPNPGEVLAFQDSTGKSEFQPLTNLYTGNGTINGGRIVTLNNGGIQFVPATNFTGYIFIGNSAQPLSGAFIGATNFNVWVNSITFQATNVWAVKSSNVMNGIAHYGAYLRLIGTNGQADFVDSVGKKAFVSNVVDLINIQIGPSYAYDYAETFGYYTAGDRGGGLYYKRPYAPGQTNMGNFQSAFDPAWMWSLLLPREGIGLRQYGAKGDGLTDDTAAIQSWLDNLGTIPGTISAGVYITSGNTFGDRAYTISGVHPIALSPAISNAEGQSIGNSAILKRKAGAAGPVLAPAATSPNFTLLMENVVIDGNKSADAANAAAYLLLLQGGTTRGITLRNIILMNSNGYGLNLGGVWSSVLDGFEISNVKQRALRINNSHRNKFRNGLIYNCEDYGIWLTGTASFNLFDDIRVSDCGLDGIFIDSAVRNRFSNMQVWGHKRSCVRLANASSSTEYITFKDSTFMSANAAQNGVTNGASPTATWPFVYVDATASSYVYHINFKDCEFGVWSSATSGLLPYGTNDVCNVFKWNGSNPLSPWDRWNFEGLDFKMQQWNYNPAMLNPAVDKRSRVVTLATRQNDENSFDNFNSAGSLNRVDGLVIESVQTAPSNLPIQVSATAHNVTTTGAAIAPLLVKVPMILPDTLPTSPPWNPDDP